MTSFYSKRPDGSFGIQYQGIHGEEITRTRDKYPYSYDPYIIWGKPCGTYPEYSFVYSDRISEINFLSYTEQKNPSFVQEKLSEVFNEKIELVVIAEGANQGSGYPYFVYGYKRPNQPSEEVKEGLFA